jgi:hypothetical protein
MVLVAPRVEGGHLSEPKSGSRCNDDQAKHAYRNRPVCRAPQNAEDFDRQMVLHQAFHCASPSSSRIFAASAYEVLKHRPKRFFIER